MKIVFELQKDENTPRTCFKNYKKQDLISRSSILGDGYTLMR